jgi:hypothetical protein
MGYREERIKEGSKMTRKEQINLYLKERNIPIASLEANSIIEGIEWADEHPNISEEEQVGMCGLGMTWQKKAFVEKACGWMKENLIDYWSGINADSSNFINDFKRTMEE